MTYKFRYRRWLLWHTHTVIGHNYDDKVEKMVLYFADGSLREIKRWKDCEIKLGVDWKLAVQKNMEKQAGQAIPLAL